MGGVWTIAQVSVGVSPPAPLPQSVRPPRSEAWRTPTKVAAKLVPKACECPGKCADRNAKLKNSFEALAEEEENLDEEQIEKIIREEPERELNGTKAAKKRKKRVWLNISTVENAPKWVSTGEGEITVDSAAEESVCPRSWGQQYPLREPAKWLNFTNASGGHMKHYGERRATFRAGKSGAVLGMTFQASDVQKPLAAVWRIADKGNRVCFGPGPEDNYIQNVSSGEKIAMIRKGGSYIIKADFVKDQGFGRQAETPA